MNNVMTWDWAQLSAMIVVMTAVLAVLSWIGRLILSRNFVSHQDHRNLGARLEALAGQFDRVATKAELAELQNKIAPLETGVAVLGVEVRGVKESLQRTERMVSVLYEHLLDQEKAE